jgi:hypothetical protein
VTTFSHTLRKAALPVAIVGAALLTTQPVGAQALIHRYSLNGGAADSIGGANGAAVGNVTIAAMPTVNGAAVFAGGTSSAAPSYISLPTTTVSALQNATVEFFTTDFTIPNTNSGVQGGQFQTLFSVATPYGNISNYVILAANRAGSGLGTGAKVNGGAETVLAAHDPLPPDYGNHTVALVYSGFSGIGSTGTETLYVDGAQVAQTTTTLSFAAVASGTGGISVVGIGGGSPFNDPTFQGSMSEVRIYDDALTPVALKAEVTAGPAVFGYQPTLQVASVSVSGVQTAQATVGWATNNAASTTVLYGTSAAYGSTATGAATAFTHSVILSGLTPGTTYHYQVVSTDIYGQTVTSGDQNFTTNSSMVSVSGAVSLQGVAAGNLAQPLTFTLTPTGTTGGGVITQTLTPAADGSFTLTNVPAGTYTLGVKGSKWLRRDVAVSTAGGSVTGLNIALLGGDANGDNQVTALDLLAVKRAYNTVLGAPNYNAAADFNCDGQVTALDLLIVKLNYNKTGDQ